MGNNKRIFTVWETGKTIYAVVVRESDVKFLDNADGTFQTTPTDMFNVLTANATQTSLYVFDESRTVWTFGTYTVNIYLQSGGSPVIADDTLIDSGIFKILSNQNNILEKTLDRGEYYGHPTIFGIWSKTTRTVTALDNIIMGIVTDIELALDADDTSINIIAGDTPTLTITLGKDLTGFTAKLYVKTNIDDADGAAIVDRSLTISDISVGIVTIKLTAGETASVGNKYAEVSLDDGAGTILTAAQFRLNIIRRVKD